ncbi:SAF domain-containing protein [Bacillus tuaregi]|uniref:SAF domain-containing protein n=1 Tax=Bacillus tuaregi TaxID=1816695 RepID=UPI000AE7F287|nr:SAF domain-containing protein [Bacillus tuaregi]
MLESKRRAAIFFILAFLLALAAGFLVFQKVKDLNAELGGMTKIYVAKGDIPVRALIQENQVMTIEIPNKFVNKAHITNKNELINNVSVVPLAAGEIITKNMVKPFSNLRNENNRLVALYPSEKVQYDQVVTELDRVDIIVSTEVNGQPQTEIFMRDVPVAFSDGDKPEDFTGAALEVSLEAAAQLIHVQNYADKVRILKANVGKEEPVNPVEEQQQPAVSEQLSAPAESPNIPASPGEAAVQ